MNKNRRSLWRLTGAVGMGALLWGVLLASGACGFGYYNDSSDPQAVSANNGVWDAGQWWPWACSNGGAPVVPASTPIAYTAAGTCGSGSFQLSVDGCEMEGNWDLLDLSDVATNISSSYPQAGGWEITGNGGDAGVPWICDATAAGSLDAPVLTLTCTDADGGGAACSSTLTEATGT